MPLARILTFDPGDAADFARHLQQLGFEVEITDPNEEQLTPADLEIEFAICDQQQVLGRASAIAAQLHSEVVVFPGAIPPLPRPISAVTETGDFAADLSRNQRFEPRETPTELPEAISEPVIEHVPEAAHLLHAADQNPDVNQTPPAQEEPIPQRPLVLAQLSERLRNGSERLKFSLGSWLAKLKTSATSAGSALAGHGLQFQEAIKQRIAQARAAREHHIEELKKRREEAERERQRQEELAVAARRQEQEMPAPPVALAQQEELPVVQAERERLIAEVERLRAEAARQAAPEQARQARLAPETLHQQQSSVPAKQRPKKLAKAVRRRSGQLRGALAGALAASFLFLVGMVLANFQAIIPVSHSLNNGSVEQQVPFGATTIHGAPGSTEGGVTVGGANAAKPSGVQQQPLKQAKPQPATSSAPVAKQKPQWHRFQKRSSREADTTANDVTITHYDPPKKATKSGQQQARLKRYSDE